MLRRNKNKTPGPPPPGARGESPYEMAVRLGFVGSEEEWLASLRGAPGEPGKSIKGDPGADGQTLVLKSPPTKTVERIVKEGPPGKSIRGERGLSAYEIASQYGFKGDILAWLKSLRGPMGNDGGAGFLFPDDGLADQILAANGPSFNRTGKWVDNGVLIRSNGVALGFAKVLDFVDGISVTNMGNGVFQISLGVTTNTIPATDGFWHDTFTWDDTNNWFDL